VVVFLVPEVVVVVVGVFLAEDDAALLVLLMHVMPSLVLLPEGQATQRP